MKTCKGCGIKFKGRVKQARYCTIECRRKTAFKKWRLANPDKHKERVNIWRKANPENGRIKAAKWNEANYERYRLNTSTWQKNNRDRINARQRASYAINPEPAKAQALAWAKANPEKHLANTNRRRAMKYSAEGSHTLDEWLIVKKSQGQKCLHCGRKVKLTKDHIIPLYHGGSDYITNIQALCKTCNSRKGTSLERQDI